MNTTKKTESARHYKLKTERAEIKLEEIAAEYIPTIPAATSWDHVRRAALTRLDALLVELLTAAKDRRTPGVIQADLQRTIYAVLTELSRPAFVEKTLKPRGRKCS